jgi:integrase
MGKITKRKDGRYMTTITVAKGKRKPVYGRTRKECAENDIALRLELKASAGRLVTDETMLVSELLERWLDSLDGKRKASTMESYRQIVRDHINPHIGTIQLNRLTPDDIQKMVDTWLKTHSTQSVRNFHARLRKALNYAMSRQLITYNPAMLVELPTVVKRPVQPITAMQMRAILAVVSGHRLELLYRMAVVMGMRLGELLALRWQDIDMSRKALYITGTMRRIKGKMQRLTGGKNDSSTTAAPIPETIMRRLIPLRQSNGYLFTTTKGNPYDPRYIPRQFETVIGQANKILADNDKIPDTVTFHTLRHSSASFLIAAGESPRMVMEHLRHSQIAITMNLYGHIFDTEHRRAADNLGEILE